MLRGAPSWSPQRFPASSISPCSPSHLAPRFLASTPLTRCTSLLLCTATQGRDAPRRSRPQQSGSAGRSSSTYSSHNERGGQSKKGQKGVGGSREQQPVDNTPLRLSKVKKKVCMRCLFHVHTTSYRQQHKVMLYFILRECNGSLLSFSGSLSMLHWAHVRSWLLLAWPHGVLVRIS